MLNKLGTHMTPNTAQLKFLITGDVMAEKFLHWINAHALKLDINLAKTDISNQGLLVSGQGTPEMLDALMVACSLGPAEVLVDAVTVIEN